MVFSIFTTGYGLTETSPVTHLDYVPGTVGSIGRLISNTEGKVKKSLHLSEKYVNSSCITKKSSRSRDVNIIVY